MTKLTEPLLDIFKPFIKPFYRKCDYVRIRCVLDYNNSKERTGIWFECRKQLDTPSSILVIEQKIIETIDKFQADQAFIVAFRNSHMRTKTEFKKMLYRKETCKIPYKINGKI